MCSPSQLARIAMGLTFLTPVGAGSSPSAGAAASAAEIRVQQLEGELNRSEDPDAVRLELARTYRSLGDVDNRLRALRLLEGMQPALAHDPDFLREYCLTLESCHRYDLACQTANQLVEIVPDEVDMRFVCVRQAVRALIRYDDEAFLNEALEQLDRILARQPAQRDALRLKSLLFAYWAMRDNAWAARAHREGLACAQQALRDDPQAIGVRLLEGVHRHGLGDDQRAEICFRRAIALMDSAERATFLRPPGGQPAGAEGGARDETAAEAFDGNNDAARQWRRLDPFPLSVVNEAQLEYWCRLTLADALFGEANRKVRGWETDPGKALVRYGPPEQRRFEPAYLGGGDASYAKFSPHLANRRNDQDTRMPMQVPFLTWVCRIAGARLSLEFRDLTLDGSWCATSDTRRTLEYLNENLPISFVPSEPAQAVIVHLLTSSFASGDARARVVMTLGFNPAELPAAPFTQDRLGMSIQIKDADGVTVADDRWSVTDADRCPAISELPLAQTTREYPLTPGDYTMTAAITGGAATSTGAIRIPFSVNAFPPGQLAVSDLELIRGGSAVCPSPMIARVGRLWLPCVVPLAGDARTLSAYFEIYNLAVDPVGGHERFRIRYTLLPRAYVMAVGSRATSAGARLPDSLALGARIDETTLTYRNCVDVTFSEERGPGRLGASIARAAALPIAGLDVGTYELIVTVQDLVRGCSVTTRRALAIMTDGEIAAAAATTASVSK